MTEKQDFWCQDQDRNRGDRSALCKTELGQFSNFPKALGINEVQSFAQSSSSKFNPSGHHWRLGFEINNFGISCMSRPQLGDAKLCPSMLQIHAYALFAVILLLLLYGNAFLPDSFISRCNNACVTYNRFFFSGIARHQRKLVWRQQATVHCIKYTKYCKFY